MDNDTTMDPETEYNEFNENNSWPMVYQKIRTESTQNELTALDARRPEFKNRNRYRDVSPYDHTRVRLERDDIDYINANIVSAPDAGRSYILTQVKCHQYYPMGEHNYDVDDMLFEEERLRVSYVNEVNYRHFTVRTIKLYDFDTETSKEVLQFHYTTWLDFKVPSLSCFLNYLKAVRDSGALDPDVGPPVIHCSAGIGRSGTFCLVDTCLVLVEKQGSIENINVQQVLMHMRHQRMGLIQTHEQLKFSYEAIIEGAIRILSGTDLGYCDPSEMENGENMTQPRPPVNMLDDGDHIVPANRDESDNETPPPLPPRRQPPPLPTSPPPDDDDEDIDLQNRHFTSRGEDEKQPNGEVDLMKEALRLLEEPPPEPVQSIPKGISEEERTEGVNLRRRLREERNKATREQIDRMKKRQAESEKWRQRQLPISPVLLGVGLVGMAGLYFLYRYYFST